MVAGHVQVKFDAVARETRYARVAMNPVIEFILASSRTSEKGTMAHGV